MGRRTINDSNIWNSLYENNSSYWHYFRRLMELSISVFKWENLPETVDARFLETALFLDGMAVFFKDEDADMFLTLRTTIGGPLDVYNIPTMRHAYASNGYHKTLDQANSVLIYNNMIHTNAYPIVLNFAKRLYELDRIIDINAKAQKTPILISCPEPQKLTMKNLYAEYQGNSPVIYADKDITNESVKVIQTGAPYVASDIYTLKTQIWNEALTFIGISNVNLQKRERLITDEVSRNMGGTIASRFSRLEERRTACERINKRYGLDIWCDFRDDYRVVEKAVEETITTPEMEREKEEIYE